MVLSFHRPHSALQPMGLFGLTITVLMPAEAAGGAVSMFEDRSRPGGGPPHHIHHDADEIFHVLAGRYRFRCGDSTLEAGAGDTLLVPRGAPHAYLNVGEDEGRLLVTMRPGGFELFFVEVFEAGLKVPDDLGQIVAIGQRYQMELLGPNPLAAA